MKPQILTLRIRDFHPVDTEHFDNLQHSNPTKLTALTREVDDLHQ